MKKFLATSITAAALFALSVVPVKAAAPTVTRTNCTDWSNPECRVQIVTNWIRRNCDLAWIELPCRNTPSDDDTTQQPDTQLPEQETPETEQPGQSGDSEQTSSVSALERKVVALVNEQRAAYGLPALTLNTQLCDGARLKSQDMAVNGYFSHESPTYGSPFDMMRSLGISYRTAGENIAMGYSSAEAVVNAWMNSEGHRANILSESYTEIGVGYIANGNYWTQWFIS